MRDSGKSFSKNFVLKMFGLLVCLIFVCAAPHPAGAAMQQTDVDGSGIEICGIDGKTYTPNGFSEDIVILFFGRTGCLNTRNMIAQGKSLMNDYSLDKSLKLVLMDVDAEDAGMESFAAANPELLVAHCDGGYSSLMFRLLSQTMEGNISSVTLPATFVLRKDRRIVFASTGYDASGLADAVLSLTADAHKHIYEAEIVTASTCISAGMQVDRCRICGIEKPGSQKELPIADHTPGAEATCTEPQTCTVCGAVLSAALGHNYVDTIVEPTETELGYTLHVCSRCQDSYKDSYVEGTGASEEQGKQPSGTTDPGSSGTSKPAVDGSSKPSTEEPSKPSTEEPSKPSAGGASVQQGTTGSGSSSRKPNLKKPSLRSAKRKAGTKAVVKWKKVSGADGYELQMSTKSKKGFRRIAKLSARKTSYTKKKLSKKKNYYFRVRAYKKVKGKYYYSAWSKVKKLSGSKK